MSYLVFGLGLLLSFCGAYSIYFGYGIIAVERGWASVIAGATALSCGVVTIALAFILRRLVHLQAALEAKNRFDPRDLSAVLQDGEPRLPDAPSFGGEASVSPSPRAGAPFSAPQVRGGWETDREARDAAAPPAEPPSAPRERAGIAPPLDLQNVARVSIEDVRRVVAKQINKPPLAQPRPVFRKDHAAAASIAPGDVETPRASETAPIAAVSDAPTITGEETMAALEPSPELRETPPTAAEAAFLALGQQILGPRIPAPKIPAAQFPVRQDAPEEALAPSPSGPAPGNDGASAIIGRYESEGTSYVMYADGSIDARSERGAFHFNSMAELKAFMGGQ